VVTRLAPLMVLLGLAGSGCGVQRNVLFQPPKATKTEILPVGRLLRFPVGAGQEGVARYVEAPPGRPTIVHFHGNGQLLDDVAPLIALLAEERLGVLAVEYPGYGLDAAYVASEESTYAFADAALRHLQGSLAVPPSSIVLMGQSLGTGVATEMAARNHGSRLILISPFTSIDDLFRRFMPIWPAWGIDDHFDNAAKAPGIRMPVLIITGLKDTLVPPTMTVELARRFPNAATLWMRSGHHNDLFRKDPRLVVAHIAMFAELPLEPAATTPLPPTKTPDQ
jgi:uncharacterized protein